MTPTPRYAEERAEQDSPEPNSSISDCAQIEANLNEAKDDPGRKNYAFSVQ